MTHNLLDKNVPVYHRFVDNQVLTNDQLNEVIDHINYQDKQTRASLIGVGNMCGIEISRDGDDLIVSDGVAVTSDGDLLKVSKTVFTGYKKFNDERVKYSHFLDEDDKILDLYELKEDSAPTNVKPLTAFESDTSISDNNKVFILYLECYPKEEEDCSPLECNAQGEEVVRNIKILVTSYANAKKIAAKDSIFSSFLNSSNENVAVDIDKFYVKRIVINTATGSSISTLKNIYTQNFTTLSNAITGIGDITLFKKQLNDFPINIKTFFNGLNPTNTDFQYLYDFYKDLAMAFNELAGNLNELYIICCPDPTAFPKHILRGGFVTQTDTMKHKFYASPIHDHNNSVLSLKILFGRLLEMIENFEVSTKNEIRITPSRHHHFSIGERALPFYYDLEKSSDPISMLNAWSLNDSSLLPNYYKANYPNLFGDPLDYCLDGHDFFRIEGHVGQNVISAVKDITDIRNQKGLGFDILPIAVGNSANEATLDYDKYNVYFEDLQIILQAWNEEIKCIVSGSSQFLSSFSLLNPGEHMHYPVKKEAARSLETHNENVESFSISGSSSKSFSIAAQTDYQSNMGIEVQEVVNSMVENIATTEGSTGSYWGEVIDIEDNQNDIKVKFREILKDEVESWALDYQVGGVQVPADVLGALKDTEDDKLLDIENFTEANLEKFITSLQIQCETGKQAKKTLQEYVSKQDSLLKNQAYLEQYYFVLNNIISTCCMIERFRVLYEEILKRKQELLDCLVLKEYIKKHPSAEHKAGVADGGTFIVLYYSNAKTKSPNNILNDQFLAKNGDEIINNLGIEVNNGNSRKIIGLRDELISDGTVIGDLCLPYICCGQSPSTTFVFPDREIDLVVSKDHVCVIPDTKIDLVSITLTPADGEVVAYVDGKEIEGGILNKEGKYFFDPNAVKSEYYNLEITFTVNGQDVTPSIYIYLKPIPKFSFDGPTFSNGNSRATIVVHNKSVEIDGQIFEWDFEVEEFENGISDFDYNFSVRPGEEYKYTLKLTAINRVCSDTFELPLEFTVPEVDQEPDPTFSIDKNSVCKPLDQNIDLVQVRPMPTTLKVAALLDEKEIENAIKTIEGVSFFDPNVVEPQFFWQEVKFTLDGQLMDDTIIVYQKPQPQFTIEGDPTLSNNNTKLNVDLRNSSDAIEGQDFEWDFDGDVFENNDEKFPYAFDVIPGQSYNFDIKLTASTEHCFDVFTDIIDFTVPTIDDDNGNNETECAEDMKKKITDGEERISLFANENKAALGDILTIYNDEVRPMYDLINSEFDKVLIGTHDATIKEHIRVVQSFIDQGYKNLEGPAVRKEWYIRMYLEMMLIYFYMQACRGESINATTLITGNWKVFITTVANTDSNLLKSILTNVPYDTFLTDILNKLGDLMSANLKNIVQDVINILNGGGD